MSPSDYKPAKFTRDNPVTKVELHNCFYKQGRYIDRPVVDAKREIGENAPKYLVSRGYARVRTEKSVDYYSLTADGNNWLRQGILRYLALHPERLIDVREKPAGFVPAKPQKASTSPKPSKVITRTRPVQSGVIRRTR